MPKSAASACCKETRLALANAAQWAGASSCNQKVEGLTPGPGAYGKQLTDVFFSKSDEKQNVLG